MIESSWQYSTVLSWEKSSFSFYSTKGTAAEPHLSTGISQKPSVLDVLSIPVNKGTSSTTEISSVPADLLHLHSKEKLAFGISSAGSGFLLEFGHKRPRSWVNNLCTSDFKHLNIITTLDCIESLPSIINHDGGNRPLIILEVHTACCSLVLKVTELNSHIQ